MKEKYQEILAKYPVLAYASGAQLAHLGISAADVEAANAAAAAKRSDVAPGQTAFDYSPSLAWNIVGKQVIRKWQRSLEPLLSAFSTDISGDTVLADDPNIHPKITVNVVDINGDEAVLNPLDLDSLAGGSSYGVEVPLDIIASGCEIPARAIMAGHHADEMVLACIETCRRKTVQHVLSKLVEKNVTDTEGNAIEEPEVCYFDRGGQNGVGVFNQMFSELLPAEDVCLCLHRVAYAVLKPVTNEDIPISALDFASVYKLNDTSGLGARVAGFIASKDCMAVGLRAPFMWGGAYSSVMQLSDGENKLPLTMVQYFQPGKMTLRVAVLTAVGARRVNGAAVKILGLENAEELPTIP